MRKLQWAGLGLGTAGLLFLAAMGLVGAWTTLPILNKRPSVPLRFKVGVLGDSQKGLANLRNIVAAVLDHEPSFLIHTGDLVSTNDEGHYRLANAYLQRGGVIERPHVVPGNHDLKGGNGDRFRAWFGDLEKSFVEREVAFVLLNNAFGAPPDPKHVEARIAAAGPHKLVVLAMHQPPFDIEGAPKPEYATFLTWLEKSKVAYLLCGHVHAYIKKKVGETTVIVNGVGGDYDSWQLNQKVYATLLEIDGATITDRRIELDPVHEVLENVEHFAVGHVAEAYRQHPVLTWLGTLLLAGGVGWGWIRIFRRPREPFGPVGG